MLLNTNEKYDLHTIILNSKSLRKHHIKEEDVIQLKGDVKEHFYELKIVKEAHNMAFKKCTIEEGLQLRDLFNGYGNIFTTSYHINEDKSELSQLFIDNCIEKGVSAVPYLVENGATSLLTIDVNGEEYEISRNRLRGLSDYIKNVYSSEYLLEPQNHNFGKIHPSRTFQRTLKKYYMFMKRISELLDN
ncbi:hypothetical protein ACTFIY_003362 [Dictyostelium cf. discoideum]